MAKKVISLTGGKGMKDIFKKITWTCPREEAERV